MGGYKKPGPKAKPKKAKKTGTLAASFIKRGHSARMRRFVVPI
jgi:hypothetical protein